MRRQLFYIVLFASLQSTCWEYSPNQIFDTDTPVELNKTNLQKLFSIPKDDTVTIAFVGDSQRFYDELEIFVEKVNTLPSVDFILLAGDISDFGLLEEFKLANNKLSKLKKPYIGVVGNHDLLANGEQIFERMFGPLNFSVIYDSIKFIIHNTNSREYSTGNVPDIAWLKHELMNDDSAIYFIAVSHIPPFSSDFDRNLEKDYVKSLRETKGLLLSLHGHLHNHQDTFPYGDGVRYITSYSFDQKSFVLLKIASGKVYKSIINY